MNKKEYKVVYKGTVIYVMLTKDEFDLCKAYDFSGYCQVVSDGRHGFPLSACEIEDTDFFNSAAVRYHRSEHDEREDDRKDFFEELEMFMDSDNKYIAKEVRRLYKCEERLKEFPPGCMGTQWGQYTEKAQPGIDMLEERLGLTEANLLIWGK